MLTPLTAQRTDGPTPLGALFARVHGLEAAPGVLAITLAPGFPYSDIRDAGMAILVTTDNAPDLAARIADDLAADAWARRHDFAAATTLTSLPDAIACLATPSERPIVLADVADNPGAGGSGDGTAILDALLKARIPGAALASIADPLSVRRAQEVGRGNTGPFILGGKTDAHHGAPLTVPARVAWLGDITFVHRGPMGTGAQSRLGGGAMLEIGEPPVRVIVTEHRTQVLDPEIFRVVGIVPEEQRVLVVKSSVHFRAAFAPLASQIIEVDSPGLASPNLHAFPYRKLRRPIWPLEDQFSQ
jgi:microcystin degradation protein MlrC